MPPNQTTPVVTVSFAGLLFFDFKETPGQCRVGVLPCPDHQLIIDIQKIEFNPNTGVSLRSSRIDHNLRPDQNLKIGRPGGKFKLFKGGINFDRSDPNTDPMDIRWLMNLEGRELGGRPLIALQPARATPHPREITQTILLTDGEIYTESLTNDVFASKSLTIGNCTFIGKVAFRVGLEIPLDEGETVSLENWENGEVGAKQELQYKDGTKYLVTIENLCGPVTTESALGSDFPLYYDAVTTVNNERFDVIRVVKNQGRNLSVLDIPGHSDLSLDSDQQNCLPAGNDPGGS